MIKFFSFVEPYFQCDSFQVQQLKFLLLFQFEFFFLLQVLELQI